MELYESTDNGKTFKKTESLGGSSGGLVSSAGFTAINNVIYVFAVDTYISYDNGINWTKLNSDLNFAYQYQNKIYAFGPDDQGVEGFNSLFESTNFAKVSKPNDSLGNVNQSLENDLLYANPINFNFDWTVLSKVTIVNNSTSTPTTKILTSGNYQIKDDGSYAVSFSLRNGDTIKKTFLLKNGYDFSQGVDTTTMNKTPMLDVNNNPIYDLDIAIDGAKANTLQNYIQPGAEGDLDSVLDDLTSKEAMSGDPWVDSFSQNNLKQNIENDGILISSYQKQLDLYNKITGSTKATESWLNWSGDSYKDFHGNLCKDIYHNNQSKDLGSNHGVILRFLISCPTKGPWSCQNFNSADSGHAYDNIVLPQKGVKDTEDAEDIANKLQGKTIVLDPKFWVGKDIKNCKDQLDNAIVSQDILTQEEVQYVSWGDLTLNQARSYPNCDFTVSKDSETAVAHNITLDVENQQDKQTFNQINNLIEKDIIQRSSDQLEYGGPDFEDPFQPDKQHINTAIPKEMSDLVNSVGLNDYIAGDDINFNKKYSQYISFDKTNIYPQKLVNMYVKVGNYTKKYQIKVWWRVQDWKL